MGIILEPRLLTAEEYSRLPDDGRLTELVAGRIVELNRPFTSHGYICSEIAGILREFVKRNDLGRVACNDAGVVTQRNPDTVRGPDVAFYSYQRIPRGPMPAGYWPVSPELAIEVRSAADRWKDIVRKVSEYLDADVLSVAVIDPDSQRVQLFAADREFTVLNSNDLLSFPDILPGFEVEVKRLFQ